MTRIRRHSRKGPVGHESAFPCASCGRIVPAAAPGTRHRNHCPCCLSSLHVDVTVGDRRSGCRSVMEPIALWVKDDGEWAIVHRCRGCGKVNTNRLAGDDDDRAVRALARRLVERLAH